METLNRIPKEFKIGLGESGSIDVTRCTANDGSRITMVVRNGHVSVNSIPVAVDEKGFVVSRDGSLLSIKYQDFYRQAMGERNARMLGELSQLKAVPMDRDDGRRLRPPRRTAIVQGPEVGLGDRILRPLKLSREKKRLPREIKRLVNRLTSKIDNLESAVEASRQTTTSTSSDQPQRSLSSICNCIQSLRHRRTGALLENEQDVNSDDNLDFVLRAIRDWQSDIQDLGKGCHQLSKSYSALLVKIREAERAEWALARTVEAFCAGAISLEKEEAFVINRYRSVAESILGFVNKAKAKEAKLQELESTNQALVERVQELEEQVQEMTNVAVSAQVDKPACSRSPDKTEEQADVSKSAESMSESEDGIGESVQEDSTATWFKAFQAHQTYWKGFHDLSDGQQFNQKVLHKLKVECGSINNENRRLTSRLGISEINSAKLKDQLRDLLTEKQKLQRRLQTSQTLLQYAQKSLINQSDQMKVGKRNMNGQMSCSTAGQSQKRHD